MGDDDDFGATAAGLVLDDRLDRDPSHAEGGADFADHAGLIAGEQPYVVAVAGAGAVY